VPVRIACPSCKSPCLVDERHLAVPVRCGHCRRPFTAREQPPRLDVAAATSPGRVRARNEDSSLVLHLAGSGHDACHEVALLVVADGMGGHDAGDRASGLVVRAVGGALAPLLGAALAGRFDVTPDALTGAIEAALREANRVVHDAAERDPACKGMGAAVTVALVWDGEVALGHVGDCRTYHLRGDALTRVTRDQTVVARMVELGTLTPEQAERHPERHLVTQAAGARPNIEPDLHRLRLAPGDWLVIASDGLTARLDEARLKAEFLAPVPSAALRARRLVDLADAAGGADNCTVVAVCCY